MLSSKVVLSKCKNEKQKKNISVWIKCRGQRFTAALEHNNQYLW